MTANSVVMELDVSAQGATQQLSDYERAMDGASAAAQKTVQSTLDAQSALSSMALGVTGVAAAIYAAMVATEKFVLSIGEMGDTAKRAGLDLASFQQLQFAAGVSGVNSKDFASGAEKMAMNLDDASRNTNDLSKLLDANNVKFKDGNTLLISNNQLWDVARGLISGAATEQQKIDVAKMLGLTKQWVPLLDQSAAAFKASKDEVSALGLVIDADVIAKAKKFDDEWRKTETVLTTELKVALAGLIPVLDGLIGQARTFAANIVSGITAAANSPQGQQFTGNAARAGEVLNQVTNAPPDTSLADRMAGVALAAKALAGNISDLTRAQLDQDIATRKLASAHADLAKGYISDAEAQVKMAAARAADAAAKAAAHTKIPAKDTSDTTDAWDKAINSIDRHAAALAADSLAVGTSVATAAGLRTEFQLLEAAKQADLGVTDDQIKAYTIARANMTMDEALTSGIIKLSKEKVAQLEAEVQKTKELTQAAELMKIDKNIQFARDTAFLSPQDLQIAQALKPAFDNVEKSMNSSQAAAMRLNYALKSLSEAKPANDNDDSKKGADRERNPRLAAA